MNVRTIGALALVAVSTLTACGSSGGSAALSKADWATQGNAICTDANTKINALQQPASAADLSAYLTSTAQIVSAHVDQLAALTAPSDYASDAAAFIADSRKEIAAVNAAAAQAKAGDTTGATAAMDKVSAMDKDGSAIAARIGLTECAKQ